MLEALRASRDDDLQRVGRQVFKHEHKAELTKDATGRTTPNRFFLPGYRGNLLGYMKLQDDMADSVEDLCRYLPAAGVTGT